LVTAPSVPSVVDIVTAAELPGRTTPLEFINVTVMVEVVIPLAVFETGAALIVDLERLGVVSTVTGRAVLAGYFATGSAGSTSVATRFRLPFGTPAAVHAHVPPTMTVVVQSTVPVAWSVSVSVVPAVPVPLTANVVVMKAEPEAGLLIVVCGNVNKMATRPSPPDLPMPPPMPTPAT
jgi:hypothetical protein